MTELQNPPEKKRTLSGVLLGIFMLLVSAGIFAIAIFMVGIMVFGCQKSPPEWVYDIVIIGFPIPLIFMSIIVPLLYIKRQKPIWIVLAIAAGIFLSCLVFFIWFLILTKYC